MNIENYHIFAVEFTTADGIIGNLYKSNNDEIFIDICGFSALELCKADEFNCFCKINDDKIIIDNVEYKILHINKMSNKEFNNLCEECEIDGEYNE